MKKTNKSFLALICSLCLLVPTVLGAVIITDSDGTVIPANKEYIFLSTQTINVTHTLVDGGSPVNCTFDFPVGTDVVDPNVTCLDGACNASWVIPARTSSTFGCINKLEVRCTNSSNLENNSVNVCLIAHQAGDISKVAIDTVVQTGDETYTWMGAIIAFLVIIAVITIFMVVFKKKR